MPRGQITVKKVLRWLLLGVLIAAAFVLALGNGASDGKTLPAAARPVTSHFAANQFSPIPAPETARQASYFAANQFSPIPASTARGGSRG